MRMPALTAGDVEDSGAGRKPENLDESRDLLTIFLEREDRLVFEQVLGVEMRSPPVGIRHARNVAPGLSRFSGRRQRRARIARISTQDFTDLIATVKGGGVWSLSKSVRSVPSV